MAKWRGPWIWNSIQAIKSNFSDGYQFGDFLSGYYGFDRNYQKDALSDLKSDENTAHILGEVYNNSRQEFLEDRAHTEAREDTAYQRGVEDMRKAGLNPYSIGSSPAPSSVSRVGENNLANKLSILGYILDIKNLDIKNRQVTNQAIGNIIKAIK